MKYEYYRSSNRYVETVIEKLMYNPDFFFVNQYNNILSTIVFFPTSFLRTDCRLHTNSAHT